MRTQFTNNMTKLTTIISSLVLLLATTTAFAQLGGSSSSNNRPAGDRRVAPLLDKAGIDYSIDDDGDYKIILDVGDGRTQLLYVISNTNQVDNMEIREVWSFSVIKEDGLTYEELDRMLRENARLKLGCWQVVTNSGKDVALFCVQMDANSNSETLGNIVRYVASKADALEKDILGTDDL